MENGERDENELKGRQRNGEKQKQTKEILREKMGKTDQTKE